jgi:hypothetical protein
MKLKVKTSTCGPGTVIDRKEKDGKISYLVEWKGRHHTQKAWYLASSCTLVLPAWKRALLWIKKQVTINK